MLTNPWSTALEDPALMRYPNYPDAGQTGTLPPGVEQRFEYSAPAGGAPEGDLGGGGSVTPISGGGGSAGVPTYDWDMPSQQLSGSYAAFDPSDARAANIKQQWWRQPGAGGYPGNVVWNPYYGWQDQEAVKNYYGTQSGPVTWDQFTKAGFQKQLDPDWSKYYAENRYRSGGTYTDPSTGYSYAIPANVYGGGEPDVNLGDTFMGVEPFDVAEPGANPDVPTEDMLRRFGYTGPMGINPYEQSALDFITQMSQGGGPLATMQPGQNFYNQVLSGAFAPQGDAFRSSVYDATKAGALQNLNDAQKMLAGNFANKGGYFGGAHSLAQAQLAQRSLNPLNEILANLNLSGYNQDLANRFQAGSGLESMTGTQQNTISSMLNNMMTGGNLLTGREGQNRAEYQNANQRAYQDWLRARQEGMTPFNMAMSLLDKQQNQPIVTQQSQSPWGGLLAGLGSMAGNLAVPGLGSLMNIPAYSGGSK